jgi:hypothetical protein
VRTCHAAGRLDPADAPTKVIALERFRLDQNCLVAFLIMRRGVKAALLVVEQLYLAVLSIGVMCSAGTTTASRRAPSSMITASSPATAPFAA